MKWKLLFLSLLCSLFSLCVFTNVSFASVNYSKFTEFQYNGSRYDFINYIFTLVFNQSFDEYGANIQLTGSNASINNFNSFSNNYFNSTYTDFDVNLSYSGNYKSFSSGINVIGIRLSKSNFISDYISYGCYVLSNGTYYFSPADIHNSGLTVSPGTIGNSHKGAFLYSNSKWYSQTGQTYPLPSVSLKYTSYKNSLIRIEHNNNSEYFIKADYNLNQTINLGYLENFDYYDEVYGFIGVYARSIFR